MGKKQDRSNNRNASIVSGKRKRNFKSTVASPYSIEWDSLSTEETEVILTRIKSDNGIVKRNKKKNKKGDSNSESSSISSQNILIGINAVTKALEKDELSLVICCRDIQPYVLIQHIPILCAVKNTPICTLSGKNTSFKLGRIFGLRTTILIGFKKNDITFKNLIEYCTRNATIPKIPWLLSEDNSNHVKYLSPITKQRTKKQKIE